MDEPMTHDRCSELLAGYVRGELPRDLADEVATHLGECADCRAEERAIVAMAGPPGAVVEGPAEAPVEMDDVERARLHRGLAQELYSGRANADVVGAPSTAPRWARWVAPVAAAAAVLAGIAVVTNLGGGSDDETAQLSAEAEVDAGGGADTGGTADAAAPAAEGGAKGGGGGKSRALGATAEQGQAIEFSAAAAPEFDPRAGTLTNEDLSEIGRSGELFRSFVDAYGPSDAGALYDKNLARLVDAAGDARGEVEACAATVPRDDSTIPVYGALAEYDGRDALVLGFVTSDPGSSELDRYVMWVWERGDCRQPIYTVFEEIER